MDFLTHYIIDRRSDIYHNIGLTLPDVIALHNRSVGFRRRQAADLQASEIPDDFRRMCRAMMRHFQLDKWFHSSALFKAAVSQIQESFTAYTGGDKMASYYAHILYEILIDRHILTQQSDLASIFYGEYKRFDFGTIVPYLQNVKNFDAVKFLDFCDLFADSTFLYDYTDKHGINRCLHKVTRRMGLEIRFRSSEETAADFIDVIFDILRPDIKTLLTELRLIPWGNTE